MTTTLPPGLEFAEDEHCYRLNGRRLVSVTQALNLLDPYVETDGGAAAARGTITHDACELHDLDQLDEDGVPEDCIGRLRAWQAFRLDCPSTIVAIELIGYHPTHLYGFRIDRVEVIGEKLSVLDIKSGVSRPVHPLQVAAYAEGYRAMTGQRVKQGACVYLRDDGSYKVEWYTARQMDAHFADFAAALRVARFRERNGIR